MSPRHKFDRVMISVEIGRDLKLRILTDSEWRAFVGGVLPIAAKSSIRGRLLVGDRQATEEDVAAQAGVRLAAARSALRKLRDIAMIVPDSEFDCERVHDFEDWNPAPKKDATAAERQQRRRDRLKRHAVTGVTSRTVTSESHAGEEKRREVEEPPSPQGGTLIPIKPSGNRKRDHERWESQTREIALRVFPTTQSQSLARDVVGRALSQGLTTDATIRDYARRLTYASPLFEEAS